MKKTKLIKIIKEKIKKEKTFTTTTRKNGWPQEVHNHINTVTFLITLKKKQQKNKQTKKLPKKKKKSSVPEIKQKELQRSLLLRRSAHRHSKTGTGYQYTKEWCTLVSADSTVTQNHYRVHWNIAINHYKSAVFATVTKFVCPFHILYRY